MTRTILKTLKKGSVALHRDEAGVETMEYLLVAALILSAAVATYSALGGKIQEAGDNLGNEFVEHVHIK